MIGKTLFFCYIFSMKSKEKSIFPKLPAFSEEIAHSERFLSLNPDKKENVLILFFALLYKNQQSNAVETYNFLFSLLEKILPGLENYTIAKFHFSLITTQTAAQQEKTVSLLQEKFSEQERQTLFAELSQSGLFTSSDNQKILQVLQGNTSDNTSNTKNSLQKILALPKEQFADLSKQIKQHIPLKTNSGKELTHPLSDFQQNLQNSFVPFYPLISSDKNLEQEFSDFLSTLKKQEYHIALVGEGKRGKSSLINALLKQEISSVEESIPQTAVPIEFYFHKNEEYYVEFLEEKDLQIQKELYARQGLFQPRDINTAFPFGKKIKIKKHELFNYMHIDGKFTGQVAKVFIGLNHPLLAQGFHISDTPGFNCVNTFHDYLTHKESLQTDCLIFVVDARKPDSGSELNFLREITTKGRVITLIGVITNIDRLNKQEKSQNSIERAWLLFEEIKQTNPHIDFLGLCPLNAKELMEHFCLQKHLSKAQSENWQTFLMLLEKAIQKDDTLISYQQKITQNAENFLQILQNKLKKDEQEMNSRYPANFLQLLEKHEQSLIVALEKYRTQATQFTKSVEKDIFAWKQQQEEALNLFEQKFIQHIQLRAHEFADTLGKDIAKSEKWKEFDQITAKELAQNLVQDFIQSQEAQLQVWEEKIKIFHQDMHTLSHECLEAVSLSVNAMGNTNIESTALNNILIQGNLKMKQLSLFLAGAGSGFVLSASFFNLLTVGSIALAFLGDPISISGLILTGIGAITLHFQGDIQKHKQNILQKKQKKIEAWAKKIRLALEQVLQEKQEELCKQYQTIIEQSFLPSFELLFSETIHIHWYTAFLKQLSLSAQTEKDRNQLALENAKHFLETNTEKSHVTRS